MIEIPEVRLTDAQRAEALKIATDWQQGDQRTTSYELTLALGLLDAERRRRELQQRCYRAAAYMDVADV